MKKDPVKVLLVEDIKVAQKLALASLEALKCQVDVADTGAKALELANKNQYDLILMDLGLPDIDGITITETIRKLPQYDKNTPIIALTAHGDDDYRDDCLECGMSGYLVKPLTEAAGRNLLDRYVHAKPSAV